MCLTTNNVIPEKEDYRENLTAMIEKSSSSLTETVSGLKNIRPKKIDRINENTTKTLIEIEKLKN